MVQAGNRTKWRWLVLLAAALLVTSGAAAASAHPPAGSGQCWVNDELLGPQDCQTRADADWEGLSAEEQEAIRATGLQGTEADQLVIDYRQAKLDAVGRDGGWHPVLERDAAGRWTVRLVPGGPAPAVGG